MRHAGSHFLHRPATTPCYLSTAIQAGIITPTTKSMFEDAERRIAALEQAVRDARQQPAPVVSVRSVIERYLRDLRATLETNVDQARRLLALAADKIVLLREGRLLGGRDPRQSRTCPHG